MLAFRDVVYDTETPAPFITTSAAKDYIGVSGSSQDALIDALIATASKQIEEYCNAPFTERNVTETIETEDAVRSFVLGHMNIVSGFTLDYDGSAVAAELYTLAKRNGIVRMVDGSSFAPGKYVAEYVVGVDDVANLPAPIIQACKELVKFHYQNKDRNQAIQRESVPDVADVTYFGSTSMTTGPSGVSLPLHVAGLLAAFVQTYSAI